MQTKNKHIYRMEKKNNYKIIIKNQQICFKHNYSYPLTIHKIALLNMFFIYLF